MLKNTRHFPKALAVTSLFTALALPSFAALDYNATAYNLVDAEGKVTAQLTSSQEGTPAIFFYDQTHVVRLNVGIFPDGEPTITLMNKEGKVSATLKLGSDDKPSLTFRENGEDKKVISLTSSESTSSREKNGDTSPAEIVTTKLKTEAEKKREYLSYIFAFFFGLVGAYGGGRIAVRRDNRVAKAIEDARKKQSSGVIYPVDPTVPKTGVHIDEHGSIIIPTETQ
jgi:hypothetical protein